MLKENEKTQLKKDIQKSRTKEVLSIITKKDVKLKVVEDDFDIDDLEDLIKEEF
jgi:hypothetical protein